MLPGFDNLRMESFMPIHEGFKTMTDDQEEFTADEIDKIHSEEEDFADIQTIKPTAEQIKGKHDMSKMDKDTNHKVKAPVVDAEEDTHNFITKYIESEENDTPNTTKSTVTKPNKTTPTKVVIGNSDANDDENTATQKEGFQGSMITQMGINKLILVTLLIVMVSFVLNIDNTRIMLKSWLKSGTKAALCISGILAIIVYIILKIFC